MTYVEKNIGSEGNAAAQSHVRARTIFITSFHGLISRVLESGILEELKRSGDVRIVIFVPDFKKKYFDALFANDGFIVVEGISEAELPKIAYFLHKLSFVLLNTGTMRIIRQSYRGYRRFYQFLIAQFVASVFGRWRIARSLFRMWNYYALKDAAIFAPYFEKYHPDLVFSTDAKSVSDTQLLIEAKSRGVFTVAMVRSWDYLTAKGMTRVISDKMIVHNEIIKDETVQYIDMSEEDILVAGIPHFDPYINCSRSSRGKFFRRIGASPTRRLILLAPMGDKFSDIDYQIFEILCEAIRDGRLPDDVVILVRLPPGDTVQKADSICRELVFDFPGVSFTGMPRKSNEMTLDDILHLADSIYHSEVVVTGPSTIAIDAAAFDRPIVFMSFDGKEKKPYYQSYVHIYDFNHMQNLMKIGGYRIARSPDEFIISINESLRDPSHGREGRAQIIKEQCWRLDGGASKRVADLLLSFLE